MGLYDNNHSGPDQLLLGWISYWNLAPLKYELLRSWRGAIKFQNGHPSDINRWLADGTINLAPCSSVCLLTNPANELAFPLGIAAQSAVGSVFLGLRKDNQQLVDGIKARQLALREIFSVAASRYSADSRQAAQFIWQAARDIPMPPVGTIPSLRFSAASASSNMLARILYKLWFGENAYESVTSATPSSLTPGPRPLVSVPGAPQFDLLIGDEALLKRSQYATVIDLSQSWNEITGLPFVFSVWQRSRRYVSGVWNQRIQKAAELAQARMKVEPQVYLPDVPVRDEAGLPIDLAAYWKGLEYRLSPNHMRGLVLFLCMARYMLQTPVDSSVIIKMLRWQEASRAPQAL